MAIDKATGVGPSRIDIAYERLGDPTAPPVLLIMGLGAQLSAWPDGLVDELVQRGLQPIRFDNRDVGQSTHVTAPYTVGDMAADAVGLLDVLGIDSAHLVGASMGGFIAQTIAIDYPARVRSLTSMLSSTGDRAVGQIHPDAMKHFAQPPPVTRAEVVQRAVEVFRAIGSPAFPTDPAIVAERTGRAFDRSFDPPGVMRQAAAAGMQPDRTSKLGAIGVPALVIHGAADLVVGVTGGRATAAAIPGAELVEIDGMGHDLPKPLWTKFATLIAATVERGEARRR